MGMRFVAILVTAAASNPYLIIAVVVLIVVFVGFRWYYISTARDVKRLEALGQQHLDTICSAVYNCHVCSSLLISS